MTSPWERQEGETTKAFGAFCVYRNLGPLRNLPRTGEELGKTRGYVKWLETWSSRHAWRTRAALWDDEMDRVAVEAGFDAIREQRRKHAAIAESILDLVQDWLKNRTHEDVEKASEVARLTEVAVKVSRLTMDQPTERTEGKVTVKDETTPTLEELLADPELQVLLGKVEGNGNGRMRG